jgi:hypothetical protein
VERWKITDLGGGPEPENETEQSFMLVDPENDPEHEESEESMRFPELSFSVD